MGFDTVERAVDLCVVGGGLAGLCAAVAAARRGAKVALMQDRPMLGGNASSEIRMWVCGAHGENLRETGILEELMLENLYRNPDCNYAIWDGVLLECAQREENLTLLLNCSCLSCEMDGNRIASVTGWQLTTQKFQKVRAALFADCSGDSVLAPITGAQFRVGREARSAFGEAIGHETADSQTMGMSLLIQAREHARASTFLPPDWAHRYTKQSLAHRVPDLQNPMENFWYLELGGTGDSIADTETVRDELLKCAYGIWDYIKNAPENREKNKNWRLDWMGILPGKRESRRYVGDHMLTQNDIAAGGRFPDTIAYGGWPMDDHDPRGFLSDGPPNVNHPAPSPYGIPYRCLYSINIENLMFAGRNISATHAAMSSARVMATCAILGQAMGTAAAIAIRNGVSPRGVYEKHIEELRQALMDDDCYLPHAVREVDAISREAALTPGCEALRNGHDRPIGTSCNAVDLEKRAAVEYQFDSPRYVENARIVFDSDLNRKLMGVLPLRNMPCNRPLDMPDAHLPESLVRGYRLEAVDEHGAMICIADVKDNRRRLRRHRIAQAITMLRLIPLDTWGAEKCRIFSFDMQAGK
ncbi:MAG: FAD-dependent oxidoreductase [Christensenellales bacterium]|jgi:hypothetical protein